jgi:hypothetical protein
MTKRRIHIKPELIEALQMLKFMLNNERLHFTKDWKTPISDMTADPKDANDTLQHVLGAEPMEVDNLLEHLMEEGFLEEDEV